MTNAIITAALTGPIARRGDHPALPCTVEEIADAARASWEAGAAVVHVHLRDETGEPTADVEVARRVIDAIGQACPSLIQLSTGVGLEVPYEDRITLLESRPPMATLNVCSMSFGAGEFRNPPEGVRRMATRMAELGIRPELEIYDSGHLDVALSLVAEGLIEPPLSFSIVLGVRGGMAGTPANLVHLVDQLPAGSVWQAIGIGRANGQMTTIALAAGGNARTGLEDTLYVEKGRLARDNGELVERLVATARALGRPPSDVAEASSVLGLSN